MVSLESSINKVARAIRGGSKYVPEPTAAHGLMKSVVSPWVGDAPPRETLDYLQAYLKMPWLRAAVSKIAYSSSTVEWVLYAKKSNGKFVKDTSLYRRKSLDTAKLEDLKTINEHPLLDLLNDPNPMFTGIATKMLGYIYLELTGEKFFVIDRVGSQIKSSKDPGKNVPVALWPVPPHWVLGTPTVDRPTFKFGYRGWNVEIDSNDVLWNKVLDPVNPYSRGTGIVRAMSDELAADEAAAQLIHAQFENRGRPETIVTVPEVGDESLRKFREEWIAESRGLASFFRTHFINVAADVKTLTQTNENMQLVELRQFSRDTIRQQIGIPPEVMGIIDNSNRSTIDASDFIFAKHVITPRLEQERQFLQKVLVPEYDDRLVIDYISPIEADKSFALSVMNAKPASFRVNEHRALAGYTPFDGDDGDSIVVPSGLVSVKSIEELKKPEAPPPGAPGMPGMPGMPQAPAGPAIAKEKPKKAAKPKVEIDTAKEDEE